MTVTLDSVAAASAPHRLAILGALHPEDGGTIVLLGPARGDFWQHVGAAPEFADGRPDPLDRWSARVIGGLAETLGAEALFPFGGPPWHPFIAWAEASGQAWPSPVSLLVHAEAGLWVSYRGALRFDEILPLPAPATRPCNTCAAPCTTACPVGALTPAGYDVAACHAYLATAPGQDCRDRGCAVRRTCPVSQAFGRDPAQSAFHMRAFHP